MNLLLSGKDVPYNNLKVMNERTAFRLLLNTVPCQLSTVNRGSGAKPPRQGAGRAGAPNFPPFPSGKGGRGIGRIKAIEENTV